MAQIPGLRATEMGKGILWERPVMLLSCVQSYLARGYSNTRCAATLANAPVATWRRPAARATRTVWKAATVRTVRRWTTKGSVFQCPSAPASSTVASSLQATRHSKGHNFGKKQTQDVFNRQKFVVSCLNGCRFVSSLSFVAH